MTKVAIVYHSGFGHTAVIAERVMRGAASIRAHLHGQRVRSDENLHGCEFKSLVRAGLEG